MRRFLLVVLVALLVLAMVPAAPAQVEPELEFGCPPAELRGLLDRFILVVDDYPSEDDEYFQAAFPDSIDRNGDNAVCVLISVRLRRPIGGPRTTIIDNNLACDHGGMCDVWKGGVIIIDR